MSKVYLPHAAQFDEMNKNLAKIAAGIGLSFDTSTWEGVQTIVKAGTAPDIFPVGTQFTVPHSRYGDMIFRVVAHDHFESSISKTAHTMTLMANDMLPVTMEFDKGEAFYATGTTTLKAGTYNFTLATTVEKWEAGTYQFTLLQDVQPKGYLYINGNTNAVLTSLKVVNYTNYKYEGESTIRTEQVAITQGNNGTSLGTLGVELNRAERVSYGSDNYKESIVRQFLNSSAEKGGAWIPMTKYDRSHDTANIPAGFLNGLDESFLSVVGKVKVPCCSNNFYESPNSTITPGTKYTLEDRFYLASQMEIFGVGTSTIGDDSKLFPFYDGAVATDRIKRNGSSSNKWWTRTPAAWGTNVVRIVTANGDMGDNYASGTLGIVPVCTIV